MDNGKIATSVLQDAECHSGKLQLPTPDRLTNAVTVCEPKDTLDLVESHMLLDFHDVTVEARARSVDKRKKCVADLSCVLRQGPHQKQLIATWASKREPGVPC